MMMIFWDKRWCSAHRVSAMWNHDQWSVLCINHWTTAFCHCGETAWHSYLWSTVSSWQRSHSHVHAAIRQVGFIELNDCAYSLDIAPSDNHLFSNLNKFLLLKNINTDDEAVTTVEDNLTDLN